MADLNIPNLNIKSDKYIFKKKLNLRRKSKRRLFTESFFLFILSVLLVYINYLIPNKNCCYKIYLRHLINLFYYWLISFHICMRYFWWFLFLYLLLLLLF